MARYPIGFLRIGLVEERTAQGVLHLFAGIDRVSCRECGPCSFVFHCGFDPTGMMALSSISRPASGGPWSMAAPAGRRPTVPAVPDSRTGHPPGAGGLPKPVFRPTHVRSVSLPRASPGHTGNVACMTNRC